MVDIPEKVWAFHSGPMAGLFCGRKEVGSNVAEYTRSDVVDRQIAELLAVGELLAKTAKAIADQRDTAEAREARLSEAITDALGRHQVTHIHAALRTAISGSGAGGWRTMDSAPKDRTPVIIAVPTKDGDDYTIGEAYFDPEHYEGGDWWWANTSDGDYYASPISETNFHQPTHWMPLPLPPEAPQPEAKEARDGTE